MADNVPRVCDVLRSGRRPDGAVFAQAKTVTSKMWRSPERAEGEQSANPVLGEVPCPSSLRIKCRIMSPGIKTVFELA